jgi:hypothetical protein
MAVDERGERSQILLFHLLELLGLQEYLLDQQGIDILSRDFDGIGKKAIHTDTASSAISSMAAARSSANFSMRCKDW